MPFAPIRRRIAAAVAGPMMALALAACQSGPPAAPAAAGGKSAALLAMEQIATAAHKCWFASKDTTFRSYSFANELNSFSGRPRFLLVPKANFGGKPLLVVQAEGSPARVDAFGPLMDSAEAARIRADVSRWANGSSACA